MINFGNFISILFCNCGGLGMQRYGSVPVGLGLKGQIKKYQIFGVNNSYN